MSRVAICLVVSACVLFRGDARAANPPAEYRAVRAALRASVVPVLLPIPVPNAFGRVRSIAVMNAGSSGYYVSFSPVAGCAGALACAFFHIAGYPAPARSDDPDRRDRPIRLADGTRGIFRPEDCSGASCMEASLTFRRRDAIYELDAKVAGDSLAALESAYANLHPLQ